MTSVAIGDQCVVLAKLCGKLGVGMAILLSRRSEECFASVTGCYLCSIGVLQSTKDTRTVLVKAANCCGLSITTPGDHVELLDFQEAESVSQLTTNAGTN